MVQPMPVHHWAIFWAPRSRRRKTANKSLTLFETNETRVSNHAGFLLE
jgi:type II secretory pathway component PulM